MTNDFGWCICTIQTVRIFSINHATDGGDTGIKIASQTYAVTNLLNFKESHTLVQFTNMQWAFRYRITFLIILSAISAIIFQDVQFSLGTHFLFSFPITCHCVCLAITMPNYTPTKSLAFYHLHFMWVYSMSCIIQHSHYHIRKHAQ